MTVKIFIATHKKYRMPDDEIYIPLHVGAEGKTDANGNPLDLGFIKDNTGDNISYLNPGFCELTGLYWAWKNAKADYIGLAHYRRHFSAKIKPSDDMFESVLTGEQINKFIPEIKVFVPAKRKYYIETLYSHYAHTHYSNQLDEAEKILIEMYPEFWLSYRRIRKRYYGYMFNMMIMQYDLFKEYCEWLFPILFELNKRVDARGLSDYQARFYGRVSEIMFNVWLDYMVEIGRIKKSEIMELNYIHMEKTNWMKKGSAFLEAKFLKKKYEGSF